MEEQKTKWLIWSFEHDAWWCSGGKGYTNFFSLAGRFSYSDAVKIVDSANKYCRTKPVEAMLPDFKKHKDLLVGDWVLVESAFRIGDNYYDARAQITEIVHKDMHSSGQKVFYPPQNTFVRLRFDVDSLVGEEKIFRRIDLWDASELIPL